ncbi:CoA transferase [Chelativorans sp. ZYF759]|uniref:CaiB/BaiF CoA transferase family protein n=1 Tax=Chelativorans sp. ZYF759 TaxID=2692213 RepID=UPI00145E6C9E|nr:CoA transferase [Chelativorans sp. ZYF759]NMG40146.1 CoA transferase [Chelativorans sp. ZYF759]
MSEHAADQLPLSGLKVLAFEQYGAGPFGTQFLADLGAEVIKVESPHDGGDMARSVGPHFLAEDGASDSSLFFQAFNRNKRSITLDITKPEGRAVLERLVARVDALACNLRGDVPARLGLTFETLSKSNPKLVCAFLSAYGREGSRANWPGYDFLMQAEAGYFSLTGEADTPPARMGLSIVDMMTGLGQAFALVSAVMKARETGKGCDIDISLFDLACFNLSYLSAWYLNKGHVQERVARSGHPSLVPCQLYRTADGWIYLMCNKEKFWPILCDLIGRPELANDPRFLTFRERLENRDTVLEILDEALSARTTAEWLALFGGKVPAAPVNNLQEALDNPFLEERASIQSLEHPTAGPFRLVSNPVRVAGTDAPARPAPALGADTDAILADAGFTDAECSRLRGAGII